MRFVLRPPLPSNCFFSICFGVFNRFFCVSLVHQFQISFTPIVSSSILSSCSYFLQDCSPEMPPLVSHRNDVRERAQKSHLMTCHYPDLSSAFDLLEQISLAAQPIRSTFLMCIVTRHQYGISALVPQTSFRGKTSEGVGKCRLFS